MHKMMKKRLKTFKKTYFLVKNNIRLKNSIKKLILILFPIKKVDFQDSQLTGDQ